MTALTIDLDDRLIQALKDIAGERRTTIDAIVGEQIAPLLRMGEPDDARLSAARAELEDLMERSSGRLGPDYKWNRAELYEHRMLPRHQRPDLRRPGSDG